ncbi:MAG: DUF4190 domain-containing protein [Clostridia bacterium]|nr:DUF4190 domain-containing protein [Clostridia bacterium]
MDNYNYDENDDTIKQQMSENQGNVEDSGQPETGGMQYQQTPQQPYQAPYQQMPQQQYQPPYQQMPPKQKNSFATASLVFGILAVLGTSTIWFGIIFSVAAIVCSIISKINTGKFDGKALAGLALGIVFLIFTLMLFFMVLTILQNPELLEQLQEMMQEYEQLYNNYM